MGEVVFQRGAHYLTTTLRDPERTLPRGLLAWDDVTYTFECVADDGADCRLGPRDPSCSCNEWSVIHRDASGAYHIYDENLLDMLESSEERHYMRDVGTCCYAQHIAYEGTSEWLDIRGPGKYAIACAWDLDGPIFVYEEDETIGHAHE